MRAPRSQLKALARERVKILLAKALETAKTDMDLAQRQAELARRICLKYNIRLPYSERQLFCRKCKRFIVPGVTARVRLGYNPKAVKITCLECGHTYRKILQAGSGKPKRQPQGI
ncbi:MAG: ribonuclease P protein component 4 [Nitrososphaerales archaeon]